MHTQKLHNGAQPHRPESHSRFLEAVERYLAEAKSRPLTGEGTIKIQFLQGGISQSKFGFEWQEK